MWLSCVSTLVHVFQSSSTEIITLQNVVQPRPYQPDCLLQPCIQCCPNVHTHIMGCVQCHVLIAHLSSLPVHSYTYTYVHVHTSNLLLPSLPSPPFHPSLPSPPSLPQKCVVLSLTDTVWAAKQVVLDKLNQVLTHIAM